MDEIVDRGKTHIDEALHEGKSHIDEAIDRGKRAFNELTDALPQPAPHRIAQAVMEQFPAALPKDKDQDDMFPGDWIKDVTRGVDLVQIYENIKESLDDIVHVAKSNGTRSILFWHFVAFFAKTDR